LHRFSTSQFQPDVFGQPVRCQPAQEVKLRLSVELSSGGLPDLLTEVGPGDEDLAGDLGEALVCLLIEPPALQRIIPERRQIVGHRAHSLSSLEERNKPDRGQLEPGVVTENGLSTRTHLHVKSGQCFRIRGHAYLKRHHGTGISEAGSQLVDLRDVEDGRIDGKGILRGDYALVDPRSDEEPLEEVTVRTQLQGKLVIVATGNADIDGCRVADPAVDCLTVVAFGHALLSGFIEASVILAAGDRHAPIRLRTGRDLAIQGNLVVSGRLVPQGPDFRCPVTRDPRLDGGGYRRASGARVPEKMQHFCVVFSPQVRAKGVRRR